MGEPRIVVEREHCDLFGVCADAAPDLLRLDDGDDEVVVLADPVPAARLAAAEAAVAACPKTALRLDRG